LLRTKPREKSPAITRSGRKEIAMGLRERQAAQGADVPAVNEYY
jgi:hypothetical protein